MSLRPHNRIGWDPRRDPEPVRSDWPMVKMNSERCCNLFSLLIKDKAQILEAVAQHVHARQNAQDPGASSDIELSTPRLGAKIGIRPEHEQISLSIDTLPTYPELLELLPEAKEFNADGLRRAFDHAVEQMGPALGDAFGRAPSKLEVSSSTITIIFHVPGLNSA